MPEFLGSVTDDGPMVKAVQQLPGVPSERALAAFTDPGLLSQWWGGELTTTLVPRRPYLVTFRKIDRIMAGEVVAYALARHLHFTWRWAHEPGGTPRTVLVSVVPDAIKTGTALTIVHGPHQDSPAALAGNATADPGIAAADPGIAAADPGIAAAENTMEAESTARAEHREGWEFFLPRLAAALSAA